MTIGQLFAKSAAAAPVLKGAYGPELHLPGVDVKTLMSRPAGYAPESPREGGFVPIAGRTPGLLDLIPATPTSSDPVTYMAESTYTNAAAEAAEGGTYGEAALGFTERSVPVGKVSVWLPVTDEELEDVEGLAATIDSRLGHMLRQRLELQMLVGNGTAPNLRGILNVVGIQTQATGLDSTAVAIRKAKTKVRTPGYGTPDLIVIHPTDSEEIDLAAAVGPTAPYLTTAGLWNLPRYESDAITLGTAIVGDFANYSALKVRRGITFQVSNSHSTFFTEGKQAIRADIRAAFIVYRPASFVSVTGI